MIDLDFLSFQVDGLAVILAVLAILVAVMMVVLTVAATKTITLAVLDGMINKATLFSISSRLFLSELNHLYIKRELTNEIQCKLISKSRSIHSIFFYLFSNCN